MKFSLDSAAFDALYPFSFATDHEGALLFVGRTLRRLHPSLTIGHSFGASFELIHPKLAPPCPHPDQMMGETITLIHRDNSAMHLRGHIVRLDSDGACYLFSLSPVMSVLSHLSQFGLTLQDFVVCDPIFDLLLIAHAQQVAKERLSHALANVSWEHKIYHFLHKITLETCNLTDTEEVYRAIMAGLCAELDWNIGHVFIIDETGSRLKPTEVWQATPPDAYAAFHTTTMMKTFSRGEGLPGRAWEVGRTVWGPSTVAESAAVSNHDVANPTVLIGVAMPIFVEGKLVAVFELFTNDRSVDSERLKQFFDILSTHISNVLARQRALAREHEHILRLATSSKMATLGEVAASIAHEINDPLATLAVTAQLLEHTLKRDVSWHAPLTSHAARITKSVEQLKRIVSSLKAFSRDSSHDPPMQTPVATIVHDSLELCRARFVTQGVKLIIAPVPPDVVIECRGSQISQVVLNLLNNAFDAAVRTPDKWVTLEVQEDTDAIHIVVTDSGDGIPPEVARKIMSPFFTTKPPGQGTGLGLSISSSIIAEHGGELRIDKDSPRTRFVVTLPKKIPQMLSAAS